jgi:transcription-repair coupling factor (superfamily II helicase)
VGVSAAPRQRRAEKDLPPDMPLPYHTWDALSEQIGALNVIHLGRGADESDEARLGDLFLPDNRFGGQIRHLIEYLHKLKSSGEISVTVSRQAEHLAQIQAERDAYIAPITEIDESTQLGSINFVNGELGGGWVLQERLHLLTDAEIFGWQRPEPRRRQRPKTATPESFFADLSPGDFVVHIEHGIARFGGLIRRTFDGQSRELLQLEYAENDLLFVPIHQAERITKYVGSEDHTPKLNRLGTQEWIKARKKASDNAEEIAAELLELYAKREVANGHAFSPDSPWQHELEASFPYIETEDQLSALKDARTRPPARRPPPAP